MCYEQRRAWVREERRARTAAEQQRRAAAPRPDKAQHSDEVPVLEVGDSEGGDGEAPPLADTIKATRPRRRVEITIPMENDRSTDDVTSANA